jgi:hypothetical protein
MAGTGASSGAELSSVTGVMTKRLPMTRGRVLALAVGAPIALAVIGWLALTEVAFASQGSYPVRLSLAAHGRPVTIRIDSGRLSVRQGAGGRLALTGTARYSLIRSTVTRQVSDTGITVTSDCSFSVPTCTFDYQVELPAGVPVTLSSTNGTISATGLTSGDVTAVSNGGSITIIFAVVPARVRISDHFGAVTLVLPPGSTAYRISAHSDLGATSVSVPRSRSSKHVITVTNGTGSISISNRGPSLPSG